MESSPSAVELTSSALRSSSSLMESAFVLNSETQAERKPSEIQAKRKLTRSEEEKRPVCVCEACMRSGHPHYLCPYRKSVKEGTPVAPDWKIICHRCRAENCHPGDKYVHRIVVRKYCSTCAGSGDHDGRHCPYLTPEQKECMDNLVKLKQRACDRLARARMDGNWRVKWKIPQRRASERDWALRRRLV